MLYVLVGESGAGKSREASRLASGGMQRIVTYTTRPIRADEINHVDYHFVNEKEFKKDLLDTNFLLEHAIYSHWHYGFTLEGIDYENSDWVLVCTPQGLRELYRKIGPKNVTSIYIKVHERERLLRLTKRGDDIDEIFRRIKADREDFKGVYTIVDVVVNEHEVDEFIVKLLATRKGI